MRTGPSVFRQEASLPPCGIPHRPARPPRRKIRPQRVSCNGALPGKWRVSRWRFRVITNATVMLKFIGHIFGHPALNCEWTCRAPIPTARRRDCPGFASLGGDRNMTTSIGGVLIFHPGDTPARTCRETRRPGSGTTGSDTAARCARNHTSNSGNSDPKPPAIPDQQPRESPRYRHFFAITRTLIADFISWVFSGYDYLRRKDGLRMER
jgi:hypothetical protein